MTNTAATAATETTLDMLEGFAESCALSELKNDLTNSIKHNINPTKEACNLLIAILEYIEEE
jgi:hypothetical protein